MFSKRSFLSGLCGILPALALVMAMILPGTTHAAGRTAQFGPYASTSQDSGTCGNDWAMDSFDRNFRVDTRPDANGNYTVEERFSNGSFVTIAGDSPGACGDNPRGTIAEGVTGTMQGNFTIIVYGGSYNADGCDTGDCSTTAGFVSSVFGSTSYDVPTFRFEFTAGGPDLSWHTWKNASDDRGGNSGDIAN